MTMAPKRPRRATPTVTRAGGKAAAAAGERVEKRGPPTNGIGFSVTLPMDHEHAIARLADGLKAEGFGILTRTDVQSTFREKLGLAFRPYWLIGVCNPALAHRALAADPEAGLLLPCGVTVEEVDEGHTLVRVADPMRMLPGGRLRRRPDLVKVAHEAGAALERVVHGLAAHARAVIL